jgi:hypothetical protein
MQDSASKKVLADFFLLGNFTNNLYLAGDYGNMNFTNFTYAG